MALFVLEQAPFEKKHFVNKIVHDLPWWHEETIQELWILESWFISNYFFSSANVCPLWMVRKHARPDASQIETQNSNQKSMFKSSLLSSFYERMWVTQTPNHHDWRNRRIAKKEEQDFCWNDTKKESSVSFERITRLTWHVALKFSRVDHNVMQLHNCSNPVHTKKQSSIWFTKTILSIDLVWTPTPISVFFGWLRNNVCSKVQLCATSKPESVSISMCFSWFIFFLIVSFSICLIIGIRIQKLLSNVCRFLGSRIWTTRTDHHRWRLEPSKWKDEQGCLPLK